MKKGCKQRSIAPTIALLLIAVAFAFGQKPVTEVKDLSFCDLLKNPANYEGRQIRITAVYRYGSEWNELYCLECTARIHVTFGSAFESLTTRHLRKKIKWSERGRTVMITAVGSISASGNFGHMGRHRREFVIDFLESAEVILKDSPAILPERLKAKARCLGDTEN